jgi:hypothetical protein
VKLSRVQSLLRIAVLAAAALLFSYHLALDCATLPLREPMGYPEVVYRGIDQVWPHQYQAGHFVDAQDNYGPGYSTFCRPFLALGLDAYVADRLANVVALVAATVLLVKILRRSLCSWPTTLAVAAIFFSLNAGSSSIQARPDFLATLLIVCVLAVGQKAAAGGLSWASAGALLGFAGLAAYLTKPYGLLSWVGAASFLLFFPPQSRRRAVGASLLGAGIVGAGIAAFAAANPYFLMETVFFHAAHADPSFGALAHQTRDFALLACALVALPLFVLFSSGENPKASMDDVDRKYWTWNAVLGMTVLFLFLGWHKGAYLTYYFHLLLPALAVLAGISAERLAPAISGIAFLANLAVLMIQAPGLPRNDPDWDAVEADLAAQPGPVVVDYLLEPLSRGRAGVLVAGNGINRFALDEPALEGGRSAAVRAAALEVGRYLENERKLRTTPPAAIYLDCILFPRRDRPGEYLAVTRNDHPLPLTGYDMGRYRPVRLFVLHPYYGSQNGLRQDAGKWIETIVKFVRGDPGSKAPELPILLVPPAPE